MSETNDSTHLDKLASTHSTGFDWTRLDSIGFDWNLCELDMSTEFSCNIHQVRLYMIMIVVISGTVRVCLLNSESLFVEQ